MNRDIQGFIWGSRTPLSAHRISTLGEFHSTGGMMATTLAHQQTAFEVTKSLPGKRFDHLFFPGIAWIMLIIVFVGFAPSYYLAGGVRAPLPSLAIHIHAVLFSSWILPLILRIISLAQNP